MTNRFDRPITQETPMTTDQRLARVEKQCTLFMAGFALVTVALAAVLLIGAGQDQDKPKVMEEVRARKLVIVGKNGSNRIILDAEKDPRLRMFTGTEKEKPRLVLGAAADGTATLTFLDNKGTVRASVTLLPSGVVGFRVYEADGVPRVSLGLDYGAELRFIDAAKRNRLIMGVTPDGVSHVSVQGGKPGGDVATIGATATNALRIGFLEMGKTKKTRTGFLKDPGKDPRLRVTRTDGTVLFEVPEKK